MCGASADAPYDGQRLILEDWGLYAGVPVREVPSPAMSSGAYQLSANEHLLLQTHTICAALGTDFGMRFKLSAALTIPVLPITVDVAHPPLMNGAGQNQTVDIFTRDIVPGQLAYIGWVFLDPSELVPGTWEFTVRSNETVLLQQQFTVLTSCQKLVS